MFLGEAIAAYDLSKTGVSPKTRKNYLQRLRVFQGYFRDEQGEVVDVDVESVTPAVLLKWQQSLGARKSRYSDNDQRPTERGGLSPATIRTYVKEAFALFDYLQTEGILVVSPATRLKLPAPEESDLKYIRDDDLLAMLKQAEDTSRRDFAILNLLADTGMRAGELCSLTLDRLDLKRQVARVKGKAKRYDDYPFVENTKTAIEIYLDVRPPTAYREVFLSRDRKPLTTGALYQQLEEIAAAVKVTGPHNPHAFRHAAARAVLLAGGTLKDVQEKLHHTSIKVTADHYAHLSKEEQHQRLDRFSPMRRLAAYQEELTSSEQLKLAQDKKSKLRLVK